MVLSTFRAHDQVWAEPLTDEWGPSHGWEFKALLNSEKWIKSIKKQLLYPVESYLEAETILPCMELCKTVSLEFQELLYFWLLFTALLLASSHIKCGCPHVIHTINKIRTIHPVDQKILTALEWDTSKTRLRLRASQQSGQESLHRLCAWLSHH